MYKKRTEAPSISFMTEKSTRILLLALSAVLLISTGPSDARADSLKIMATTTDLATLLQEVGGERVETETICKGYQDPHYLQAKPSYVAKLRRAHAIAYVGLELEVGWLPLLIEGARNDRLLLGRPGNIPFSIGLPVLEIPTGELTRAAGDVHPFGNPHYWLDPRNLRIMAQTAETALNRLDPEGAELFGQRRENFVGRLDRAIEGWNARMQPHRGKLVVCYHKQWEYLLDWLGLEVVGYVENRAGIPPSPRHVAELEKLMRSRQVPLLLISNFFEPGPAERLAKETGATMLILPASVAGEENLEDFFSFFDHLVDQLDTAFQEASSR